MRTVYLSLGTNVGDRSEALAQALRRLREAGLAVTRVSSVYETEPVGAAAGPDPFLNIVAAADTALPARAILEIGLAVERAMGRLRTIKGGPRTIDIDLLLAGGERISEPDLEVPHPRMLERRFVLAPLAEIAPDLRHPVTGLSAREALVSLGEDSPAVERLEPAAAGPAGRTA